MGQWSTAQWRDDVRRAALDAAPDDAVSVVALWVSERGSPAITRQRHDGLRVTQTRGVLTIDTFGSPEGDIGVVAAIPVGMSQVASVVLTATVGQELSKGEEMGYFQFGGSDIEYDLTYRFCAGHVGRLRCLGATVITSVELADR